MLPPNLWDNVNFSFLILLFYIELLRLVYALHYCSAYFMDNKHFDKFLKCNILFS